MNKEYIEEVKQFIKDNNMNDVFVDENLFNNDYGIDLYVYLRVSTEKQDFGRQLIELYEWAKKKGITIFIDNIFCDKYTGKRLNRNGYISLKEKIKQNDYLLTTNLNRLGRNWDEIKKEWYNLEYNNINRIIQDNENLSIQLPNEQKEQLTLSRKMVQDITFSACLYSACQKIEEVSQSTKDGLKKAVLNGKKLGRPISKNATTEKLIETFKLIYEDNYSMLKAIRKTCYPRSTFFYKLKEFKKILNTEDLKIIIEKLEKGEIK